jgi:hypothetical protein
MLFQLVNDIPQEKIMQDRIKFLGRCTVTPGAILSMTVWNITDSTTLI